MEICFEVTLQFTYITVLGFIQMLSCYIEVEMVDFEGMSSTCQSDSNINDTARVTSSIGSDAGSAKINFKTNA